MIRRRAWHRARMDLRSFRHLRRTEPFALYRVIRPLERAGLALPNRALTPEEDTCLRQRLFSGLRVAEAQAAIARAIALDATIVLPIPRPWRQILRGQGIRVDEVRSTVAFVRRVLALTRLGLRTYRDLARAGFGGLTAPRSPYAVAMDLHPAIAPVNDPRQAERRDFTNWAARWSSRTTGATHVWAHVPHQPSWRTPAVTCAPVPFPRAASGLDAVRYSIDGAVTVMAALGQALIGRWWSVALLSDVLTLQYFNLLPRASVASAYVFNNSSSWLIRPLWTYTAEREGVLIAMTYYSANSLMFDSGMPPAPPHGCGEALSNWPYYVVLSRAIAASLAAQKGEPVRYEVDPHIDVSDSARDIPRLPPRAVAVFDVTPIRECALAGIGLASGYYTADQAVAFLEDIRWACGEAGAAFVLKRKRDVGRLAHKRYISHLEGLAGAAGVFRLDTTVAASRVVAASAATVSAPFSSPSVTAHAVGKPAAYYDPDGTLASVVPSAHGVPVLGGREALLNWLVGALGERTSESGPMRDAAGASST